MQRESTNSLPSTTNADGAIGMTPIHGKTPNIPIIGKPAMPRVQNQTRRLGYGAYYRNYTNLSQLLQANHSEQLQQGCRPASVTPTNLSPLSQCPTTISVFEYHEPPVQAPIDHNAVMQHCYKSCTVGVHTEWHQEDSPILPHHKVQRVVVDVHTPTPSGRHRRTMTDDVDLSASVTSPPIPRTMTDDVDLSTSVTSPPVPRIVIEDVDLSTPVTSQSRACSVTDIVNLCTPFTLQTLPCLVSDDVDIYSPVPWQTGSRLMTNGVDLSTPVTSQPLRRQVTDDVSLPTPFTSQSFSSIGTDDMDIYTPVPLLPRQHLESGVVALSNPITSQPLPMSLSSDNKVSSAPEELDEFIRPRIAALEPRCSCLGKHPTEGVDAQKVLWGHTAYCRLMQKYNEDSFFLKNGPRKESAETRESIAPQESGGSFRARSCLRVEALPQSLLLTNYKSIANFFLQFPGFCYVRAIPDNQDYLFVGYATEEQAQIAKQALDGMLISQLNKLSISSVSMEQALYEIHGNATDDDDEPRCCCFNYLF